MLNSVAVSIINVTDVENNIWNVLRWWKIKSKFWYGVIIYKRVAKRSIQTIAIWENSLIKIL